MKAKERAFASRFLRLGAGLALSLLTLYLAFKNVSLGEVGQAFTRASPLYIVLALASVGVNTLAKVFRWEVLLGRERRKAGFYSILNSVLAGQMLNAVIPVRTGELYRIYVVGGKGVGRTFVLGTVVLEKVLDMVCYALLFLLLLALSPLPAWVGGSGTTFIGLAALACLLVLLVAYRRGWVVDWMRRLGSWLPVSFQDYLARHLRLGLDSLEVLQHFSVSLKLALWSALVWFVAILTNQLVLLAFGLRLPWAASVLLLVALQAGISLPSLPGKIGVFEYVAVLSLGVFRIEPSLALSYGILLHAIVYLPMLLAGLISFWLLDLGPWRTVLAGAPTENLDSSN